MRTYRAITGQSIFDVCLQTYGSLDYLYKLMQDNGINGVNEDVLSRQPFVWDDSLVVDQQINAAFLATSRRYATAVSALGAVYYVVNQGGSIVPNTPENPYTPPNNENMYEATFATSFTAGAPDTVSATIQDVNGNLITGCDIVQVEKEIKPLKATDYVWNKNTSQITLLNGLTLDTGESLFVIYKKTVTG